VTDRLRSRGRPASGWSAAVVAGLVISVAGLAAAAEPDPRAIFDDAVRLFFAAEPVASARAFDELVAAVPRAEPDLWQRGLALYYAERFTDGRKQFELHRTVNPADVENSAWHFLCVARLEGIEAARRGLLPVGEDRRVPMREILDLDAGRGDPAAVLAAAEAGEAAERRNQPCYAHLYLGLFHEVAGDAARARHHVTQAAGPFRMDHFMGRVADVHARLRQWPVEPASPPPP
jgi:lipoprotein NlpI